MVTPRHPQTGRYHDPAKSSPATAPSNPAVTRPTSAPLRSPSIVGQHVRPASIHPKSDRAAAARRDAETVAAPPWAEARGPQYQEVALGQIGNGLSVPK